jgi:bifunctional non-homologous end joining protein LigD
VVFKVQEGCYNSGRGNDWVKMTCQQRETLPITDFTLKENRFDGIYIGQLKGKVDHGFDDAAAKDLQARPNPLIRRTQHSKKIAHRGIWVDPYQNTTDHVCDNQQHGGAEA